jgi:hypothetical protein
MKTTQYLEYDSPDPYDDYRTYDGLKDDDETIEGVWKPKKVYAQSTWKDAKKIDDSQWKTKKVFSQAGWKDAKNILTTFKETE